MKGREVLKAPRRAFAETLTQNQTEIEAADVNQQTLQYVFAAAEMKSAHSTGFVAVRE
jgi:hypothetical protein